MLNKNDLITIDIETITSEGSGVGHSDGIAVFVPMTAPGDRIRAKIVRVQKTFCYGIIDEIITPSDQRIQPDCPIFSRCGGCSLRHIDYRCELAQKQQWVTDALRRLGGLDLPVQTILPSPSRFAYRNKAQYPIGKDCDGKAFCGFFASRSHTAIPAESCLLQPDFFRDICRVVCSYIDGINGSVYDESTGEGLFRHLYIRHAEATGQVMVCLVINGYRIPHTQRLVSQLLACNSHIVSIQLNHNLRNTNVILGNKNTLIYGSDVITDQLCGLGIDISPLSFYQVNRAGAEQLYRVAGEFAKLQEGEMLLDLYCGAGTIGLSMVKDKPGVRLVGVEISDSAVNDARLNAKRAGIDARFIAADAGEAAAKLAADSLHPDVVVVDPPRKGCDEATLAAILQMQPQRIVMVSCNPATMARDMAWLCKNSYKAVAVQPVDMFARTRHVETVCLMTRVGK